MKICYHDKKACNGKQGIWWFGKKKKLVSTQKWKTMLKMEHPEKTGLVGADCVENREYNQHEKPADV